MKKFTFMGLSASTGSIGSKFAKGLIASIMLSGSMALYAADFGTPNFCVSEWGDDSRVFCYDKGSCLNYEPYNSLRKQTFYVEFPNVSSITVTDVAPYFTNGLDKYYFNSITYKNNKLILSGLDQAVNDLGMCELVIPDGTVLNENSEPNDAYYATYWGFGIDIRPLFGHDGKIITGFVAGQLPEGVSISSYSTVSVYDPSWNHSMTYHIIDGGSDVGTLYYCEAGVYYASAEFRFEAVDGYNESEPYYGSCNYSANIHMPGFSTETELDYIQNENGELTDAIIRFINGENMDRTWEHTTPYVESESGERLYLYDYDFRSNEIYIHFDEPITEPGKYQIVFPENSIGFLIDYIVPITDELRYTFSINPIQTAAISDIMTTDPTEICDVYNAQGIKLASKVNPQTIATTLGKGIYLLKGETGTKKLLVP